MANVPISWEPSDELVEKALELFEIRKPGLIEEIKILEIAGIGLDQVSKDMLPLIKELVPDNDIMKITKLILRIRRRAYNEVQPKRSG
jgi:hypothetical protein